MIRKIFFLLTFLSALTACRNDELVYEPEREETGGQNEKGDIAGLYVLNEGNMGSNKASLDYLDLASETGSPVYNRNIYSANNPGEVKELGDVGNDIKVYGSKLWMVINCSNKVEVANAYTCKKQGQINIPNCRYVCFDGPYAYVSAYVAPVSIRPDAEVGAVYKVDTLSLQIVDKVTVGYQPEELAVVGEKLYVANSGGYRTPNYDRTVSEIDLKTFKETRKIDVDINLSLLRADRYGQLWTVSRGDYKDIPSRLYWLQRQASGQMEKGGMLDVPVSNICIVGDSLYYIGVQYSKVSQTNTVGYGIINVKTHEVVSHSLSSSPELQQIEMPYGIVVNPEHRDFYLMDAKNYVSSGRLLHFKADGSFEWAVNTGDIPGHAAFVYHKPHLPGNPETPSVARSKYLQAVDEYVPAPGQYVNTMPAYEAGDDAAAMARKCTEAIGGDKGGLVSLGGYGGYITFHFDHPVVNVEGAKDFLIRGNAFEGNSEPGIVMVSEDVNGNGLPDDPWYELSGSADADSVGKVVYHYEITYTAHALGDIPWTDNRGKSGFVYRNQFHAQEYFPQWLSSPLTFAGTLLPPNGENQGTADSPYWVLSSLRYGYADNRPNADAEGCSFDIGWAVDANRRPVKLSRVHFIRVYCAQNQSCGWLGETSTEISGAEDLHVEAES
mgnify:CR=1 FL=1